MKRTNNYYTKTAPRELLRNVPNSFESFTVPSRRRENKYHGGDRATNSLGFFSTSDGMCGGEVRMVSSFGNAVQVTDYGTVGFSSVVHRVFVRVRRTFFGKNDRVRNSRRNVGRHGDMFVEQTKRVFTSTVCLRDETSRA